MAASGVLPFFWRTLIVTLEARVVEGSKDCCPKKSKKGCILLGECILGHHFYFYGQRGRRRDASGGDLTRLGRQKAISRNSSIVYEHTLARVVFGR